MEQEWQQVSRRRRGKARTGNSHVRTAASRAAKTGTNGDEEEVEPVPEVSKEKQTQIIKRVRAIADVLRDSKLLEDALSVVTKHFQLNAAQVKTPAEESAAVNAGEGTDVGLTLVGYGLGSFCASSNAVHQLGFLVALREALDEGKTAEEDGVATSSDEVFDPAMNQSDAAIAEHFKLKIIKKNEHGRRHVASNTVFFMPHCGKALYQNVLACNWGPALEKLLIIGNSFSAYGDRVLSAKERQELLLVGVLPYLEEVSLPCGVVKTHEDFVRYEAAFNDLSVHRFPSELLTRALTDQELRKVVGLIPAS